MSSTQVLNTTELLEAILYELPPRDLLLAQCSNKRWNTLTNESTKLQQSFFSKPVPYGPFDSKRPPSLSEQYFGLPVDDHTAGYAGQVLQNPLLKLIFNGFRSYNGVRCHHIERAILDSRFNDDRTTHPSWRHSNASWRLMLPTQPPLYSCFAVEFDGYRIGNEDWTSECKNALLMGDVLCELDVIMRFRWNESPAIRMGGSLESVEYLKVGSDLEGLVRECKSEAKGMAKTRGMQKDD